MLKTPQCLGCLPPAAMVGATGCGCCGGGFGGGCCAGGFGGGCCAGGFGGGCCAGGGRGGAGGLASRFFVSAFSHLVGEALPTSIASASSACSLRVPDGSISSIELACMTTNPGSVSPGGRSSSPASSATMAWLGKSSPASGVAGATASGSTGPASSLVAAAAAPAPASASPSPPSSPSSSILMPSIRMHALTCSAREPCLASSLMPSRSPAWLTMLCVQTWSVSALAASLPSSGGHSSSPRVFATWLSAPTLASSFACCCCWACCCCFALVAATPFLFTGAAAGARSLAACACAACCAFSCATCCACAACTAARAAGSSWARGMTPAAVAAARAAAACVARF
mmetsp:Transcript_20204/g.64884  ORF Transcript_20204/g.64884 Transcript_20204/m.64884 type:complete len:343 (+) Transcript_20204:347-1375(+)